MPKKYILSVPSSIQTDRELVEKLSGMAKGKGLSMSSLIRMILVSAVDEKDIVDQVNANAIAIIDIFQIMLKTFKPTDPLLDMFEQALNDYQERMWWLVISMLKQER